MLSNCHLVTPYDVMSLCQIVYKPLPEPMLTNHQLDIQGHILREFYWKLKHFHSKKCIWICHQQNVIHLVQVSMWICDCRSSKVNNNSENISMGSLVPGGCITNVSRALQNNLAKIYNARNNIYAENFKLKLCTCAQSMALGTRTKFQLEILIRMRF